MTFTPLRNNKPRWWAGMYEGKTPQQVRSETGTRIPKAPNQLRTEPSMRGFNAKHAAIRRDGKLCKSINGLP